MNRTGLWSQKRSSYERSSCDISSVQWATLRKFSDFKFKAHWEPNTQAATGMLTQTVSKHNVRGRLNSHEPPRLLDRPRRGSDHPLRLQDCSKVFVFSLSCFLPKINLSVHAPPWTLTALHLLFCFILIFVFPKCSACFLFSLCGVYTASILQVCGVLFLLTHKSNFSSQFTTS